VKDVLEDVLVELKEANGSLTDMRTRLNALEGKMNGFEQTVADMIGEQGSGLRKETAEAVGDMRKETAETVGNMRNELLNAVGEMQQELSRAMGEMRKDMAEHTRALCHVVELQPKPIIRQWRISLFPERDHSGSWKHFINWLFGSIVLALLVGALYALGRQYMEQVHPAPAAETMAPVAPAGSGLPPLQTGKTRERRTKKERIPKDSSRMQ